MRIGTIVILIVAGLVGTGGAAWAQQANSCKVCSEQRRACIKNYPGPTCKTEYQVCMKSCGKK